MQSVLDFFSPEVNRVERDDSRSSWSSAEVSNEWSYTSTPPTCLSKLERDNFIFSTEFVLCVLILQLNVNQRNLCREEI